MGTYNVKLEKTVRDNCPADRIRMRERHNVTIVMRDGFSYVYNLNDAVKVGNTNYSTLYEFRNPQKHDVKYVYRLPESGMINRDKFPGILKKYGVHNFDEVAKFGKLGMATTDEHVFYFFKDPSVRRRRRMIT